MILSALRTLAFDVTTLASLGAALIALVGVVTTLAWTSWLDRRQSRLTREDAYRHDLRGAIGKLLVDLEEFRRHGSVLSRPEFWTGTTFEYATNLANLAETTLRSVNTSLINAQLHTQDVDLHENLNAVEVKLDDACEVMHDAVDSFWETRPMKYGKERTSRWEQLHVQSLELREFAKKSLAPTIRAPKGFFLGTLKRLRS